MTAGVRAVIFDFDGLLADTEGLHFETFAAVLAEEGIVLPPEEDGRSFLGLHDRAGFEKAFRDAGRELAPKQREQLVERKSRRYQEGLLGVRLFPGARELAGEALRRGPATVASCGRREDIAAVLGRHGLLELFPRFVSADDIRCSKPDPECFLKALELLRAAGAAELAAADCLVFEDSARGVEAAKRAGMRCVAVCHSVAAAELAAADRVIGSLEEWRWEE
jgi:beta-phosphoglucomutase